MNFKDFLTSLLDLKPDHMLLFITIVGTLIPFTSTTLVFFPEYVAEANFLMYFLLALVTGVSTILPSTYAALAIDIKLKKDLDNDAVLFVPMLNSIFIGTIWLLVISVYYLFFLEYGFKIFLGVMTLVVLIIAPLSVGMLFGILRRRVHNQ